LVFGSACALFATRETAWLAVVVIAAGGGRLVSAVLERWHWLAAWRRTPEEMRCKLNVQFQGEEGIDAGGVSREWYQVRKGAGHSKASTVALKS
jgi:hypothetical protein